MIKEYASYIKTGRFSDLTEKLENAVRYYEDSFSTTKKGDANLREKARLLFEDELIKSGLRTQDNSFINIDLEFFENGELIEERLNSFIKNIIKAHCYQKILWEYMGTTGLLTDISKEDMKKNGKDYSKLLPIELKKIEEKKQHNKIDFSFNKLEDNSGFNWSQSYDVNYSVNKAGWYGAYDENDFWNYYKIESNENTKSKKNNQKQQIKVVKTEKGVMLYDADSVLINPVILWYLFQYNEVYGGEKTDTVQLVEEIRNTINSLGEEKITEIACGDSDNKDLVKQYKTVLGSLADSKIKMIDLNTAEKKISKIHETEKSLIVESKLNKLRKRIASVREVRSEISDDELISALETGKVNVPINVITPEDLEIVGFSQTEYLQYKELLSKLRGEKAKDFTKVCLILSINWKQYESSGKSKEEAFQLLYGYIANENNPEFCYERTLSDLIFDSGIDKNDNTYSVEKEILFEEIKNLIPQENQVNALEYIEELPEQDVTVQKKVYRALSKCINNYIEIRSSTGLSIKELFDYAVKTAGGKLSKTSYVPPVIGYVTPGYNTKIDAGQKRIYFESSVENLYAYLMQKDLPHKEVSVTELEKVYEEKRKQRPTVLFSVKKNTKDYKCAIENSSESESINPLIVVLLKNLYLKNQSEKERVLFIAKASKTEEEFIERLKSECNIEYSSSEKMAQKIFRKEEHILKEYVTEYEKDADDKLKNGKYKNNSIAEIKPLYKQINDYNELPSGLIFMEKQPEKGINSEKIAVIQKREQQLESNNIIETKKIPADTEVKNLLKLLSNRQREEISQICKEELLTPLLIKEYLKRKKNNETIERLYEEVNHMQKTSSYKKGWKLSANSNFADEKVSHTVLLDNKPAIKEQKDEINLESVKGELQENIEKLYKTRRGGYNGKNSGVHSAKGGKVSGNDSALSNSKESLRSDSNENLTAEERRMQRINSNYEHDRAILAKTDPEFMAKDQMYGVGHADGEDKLEKNIINRCLNYLEDNVESVISGEEI